MMAKAMKTATAPTAMPALAPVDRPLELDALGGESLSIDHWGSSHLGRKKLHRQSGLELVSMMFSWMTRMTPWELTMLV